MLNEYPKSTARVKYCSAPSRRCAACSSSVRSTARASNSSGPISFWPPSPRVAESSAVRWPSPFDRRASSALFSSSGWATIDRKTPVLFRAPQGHRELRPTLAGFERLGLDRGREDADGDQERYGKRCESTGVHGASGVQLSCKVLLWLPITETGTLAAWSGRRENESQHAAGDHADTGLADAACGHALVRRLNDDADRRAAPAPPGWCPRSATSVPPGSASAWRTSRQGRASLELPTTRPVGT